MKFHITLTHHIEDFKSITNELTYFWAKITHMPKTWSLCGLHPLKGSSHATKDFVYGNHSTKKCTFALVNTSIIIKKCISLLQHRFVTQKAYLKA
jgi:hypothetical protein